MFVGSQALSSSPEMTLNLVLILKYVLMVERKCIHCAQQIGLTLSLFVGG